MLKSLHTEINRLSNELREEKRKAACGEETTERIAELEKTLAEKDSYTKSLEKKVTSTIQKLQEQITIQVRNWNEQFEN